MRGECPLFRRQLPIAFDSANPDSPERPLPDHELAEADIHKKSRLQLGALTTGSEATQYCPARSPFYCLLTMRAGKITALQLRPTSRYTPDIAFQTRD